MVLLSSILGGIAMLFLEQLAISLMGALIGGGLIQELVTVNQQEWYWPILGAFLGSHGLGTPLNTHKTEDAASNERLGSSGEIGPDFEPFLGS